MSDKRYIEGHLDYNEELERYGLVRNGEWERDGFHMTEPLEVLLDGVWVHTEMNYDHNLGWVLRGTPYSGDLWNVRARILARDWEQ